jgi:hypothetical protein
MKGLAPSLHEVLIPLTVSETRFAVGLPPGKTGRFRQKMDAQSETGNHTSRADCNDKARESHGQLRKIYQKHQRFTLFEHDQAWPCCVDYADWYLGGARGGHQRASLC